MTLEEDEDIDLNPALPASGHQAGCEKQPSAKTMVQLALTRCAETVAVIPIIILLLPVYTLIQVCVVAVRIYRFLRGKTRRQSLIPDACSAFQNLRVR
jgi:hypothetical protein